MVSLVPYMEHLDMIDGLRVAMLSWVKVNCDSSRFLALLWPGAFF